jgi:YegS/Rv2252/BmrU family lipid kinase
MKMSTQEKKPQPLVILNPNAGVQPVNFIISRDLDRRKNDFKCYRSNTVVETNSLIKEHFSNHDVFIAAGGDGTVHTVATGLVGSEKIFGVLPMGSGNGFAKEFGFKTNLKSLLSCIEKGETMDIDIIDINGHLCLNVAGIGLDSFVAHSFNELKLRGFIPYIWLTLKTFLRLRPFHVNITDGGKQLFSGELFVLTIANTRQFGNNAFIAPAARPNDGMIELVMVKPFPKILGPIFIIRLFSKKISKSKYVYNYSTDKEINIQTDETRFHIDGEPIDISGNIIVKLKKEVLKVLKTPHNKFITKS